MDDIVFITGDFAVYKGEIYRAVSYMAEYALYLPSDKDKKEQIYRIPKEQAESYYTQFADCDIHHVRYKAIAVNNKNLLYRLYCGDKNCKSVPLEECNEIWIQRNFPDRKIEIEVLWHNPSCTIHPSSEKFYAERMASGKIMVSYLKDLMNFEQTLEAIQALYGERMKMKKPICVTEIFQPFTVDEKDFVLSLDDWDIVCISPEQTDGIPYIHEMVSYFNSIQNDMNHDRIITR